MAEPPELTEQEQSAESRPDPRGLRLPVLAMGTALTVALALIFSAVSVRPAASDPPVTVHMAGSDPFSGDRAIAQELRSHGIDLQSTPVGTLQIADLPGLATRYDVAAASSDDAADRVQTVLKDHYHVTATQVSIASTPIVIVTTRPIVNLLRTLGVVTETGHILIFNVQAYLRVVRAGTRWDEIPGSQNTYPSKNRILVWTTDPASSNSAAMFAAILGSAQLDDDPITEVRPSDPYLVLTKEAFTEQGSLPTHTPDLMEQFLADTSFAYPMFACYESDYIYARLTQPTATRELAVMYPNPTVISDRVIVEWTPRGKRYSDLLSTGTLRTLEEQNGYRTGTDRQFVQVMAHLGITVSSLSALQSVGVQEVHPPTDANLQALAEAVDG